MFNPLIHATHSKFQLQSGRPMWVEFKPSPSCTRPTTYSSREGEITEKTESSCRHITSLPLSNASRYSVVTKNNTHLVSFSKTPKIPLHQALSNCNPTPPPHLQPNYPTAITATLFQSMQARPPAIQIQAKNTHHIHSLFSLFQKLHSALCFSPKWGGASGAVYVAQLC